MAVSIRDAQIAYDLRLPDEDDPALEDARDDALEKYLTTRDGINELLDRVFWHHEDEAEKAFIALMDENDPQPLKNVMAKAFQEITGWSRDYAGYQEKNNDAGNHD